MPQLRPIGASLIPNVSQAVAIDTGRLVFLSGHVPLGADGALIGPGLAEQADQVFRNLADTLNAAGATFAQVARLTLYVTDLTPTDLPVIRAARDRYIDPAHPPASALIGVAGLYDPAVRIEIDAIAAI